MSIPKNPVGDNRAAINGAYLNLGINVGRLFNMGESSSTITAALRKALDNARHDGVGQEA